MEANLKIKTEEEINSSQIPNEGGETKPVKKKRGRKPKPKDPNQKKSTPKKRGRKKKEMDPNQPVPAKEEKKKKRGRKPTSKLINIDDENLRKIETEEDCIIAHIPVKMDDIVSYNNNKGKRKQTDENLSSMTNISFENFSETNENVNIYNNKYVKYMEDTIENLKKKIEQLNDKINNKKKNLFSNDYDVEILDSKILSYDGVTNVSFSKQTDVCCWWCCHQFDNIPFPLPESIESGIFHVYGVFCSPNCAMAYNQNIKDNKVWSRNTLIFRLYSKMTNGDKDFKGIYSAQPRQKLKMFGGSMDIDTYRKHNMEICNSRFILPPMVPLKTLIEESYKDRNKYKWDNSNAANDRYNKLKNNIKLRRTKPIKNNHNDLMKAMKIRKIKISE